MEKETDGAPQCFALIAALAIFTAAQAVAISFINIALGRGFFEGWGWVVLGTLVTFISLISSVYVVGFGDGRGDSSGIALVLIAIAVVSANVAYSPKMRWAQAFVPGIIFLSASWVVNFPTWKIWFGRLRGKREN